MGRAKKFSLIRKGSIYFFKLFFLFKNTIFGNTFLKPFFFFFFAENYTKCILLSKDIFLLPLDVLIFFSNFKFVSLSKKRRWIQECHCPNKICV